MAATPSDHASSAARLVAELEIPHELDAPLAPLTWYGLGGPADVLAQPETPEKLGELVSRCRQAEISLRILGAGANLLVDDAGVDGVVVQLTADRFTRVNSLNEGVAAGAGADLPRLVLETGRRGLAGLETLAGIPATVGGAVRMNAGGKYGAIGQHVASVLTMRHTGEIRSLDREHLEFDYRRTNISDPIILEAEFSLEPTDPVALREQVKEIFSYKKSTQPLAAHSAGCAFRNPVEQTEQSAGSLIDQAGLKGERVGAAEISSRHANFIIVHPGGKSRDVLGLIRVVQKRVAEQCGVDLEPELVLWSRGNSASVVGAEA